MLKKQNPYELVSTLKPSPLTNSGRNIAASVEPPEFVPQISKVVNHACPLISRASADRFYFKSYGFSKFPIMQKLFVLLIALLMGLTHGYGFSDVKVFTIAGNVFELDLTDSTEKGIVKVPIEIWSGDQKITTIESGPKGKYKVDLAYYPSYTLRFGAAPYVAKVIEIQTDGVHRAAEFGIVNLDLDITLFRDQNYMGLDFLNYTPIAKASFNKKKGQLVWDYTYGDAMNSRVRGIIEANKK
jgi:hypothetical protein